MLHPDSLIGRFLSRFLDFLLVNILLLICSIPIVTAGAALSSLYAVVFRWRAGEEGVVRPFFREFRTGFLCSLTDTVIMAVVGAGIVLLYLLCGRAGLTDVIAVRLAFCIAAFLYVSTLLWLYPILSRFNAPALKTLRNAFLLSVCSLPATAAMLLIRAVLIFIFLRLPREALTTYLCFIAFFSASVTAWCDTFFLKGIFQKYQSVPIEQKDDCVV